jgi:hypothetical protein
VIAVIGKAKARRLGTKEIFETQRTKGVDQFI